MGRDPEALFRRLMVTGPQGEPLLDKWIAMANELFGRPNTETSIEAQPGELSAAIDQRITPWIAQVGTGLREWIEAIVEDPQCRVAGGKRAANWFLSYLKGLVDKVGEARLRLGHETAAAQHAIFHGDVAPGKARKTKEELSAAFLQYCRSRLFEFSAHRAGQIVHALQSHALAAHDAMIELQRELDHLTSQFPVEEKDGKQPSADVSAVRSSVRYELNAAEESLARQVDDQLTAGLFAPQGGLRVVVSAGGDVRENLLASLRVAARQAALAKVQSVDLASLLLANPSGESPLAKSLAEAKPRLERCGGRRRLVFVLPQQLVAQYSPASLAGQLGQGTFGQLPAVAPGSASDLVVLFELGDISLPHAAALLINHRRDLAEASGRLLTRGDVQWTPVFSL
jgi:hypothetical protein